MTESNYTCSWDSCEAHPEKGDAIMRTSPKGGPFEGLCIPHYRVWKRMRIGPVYV